MIGTDTIISRMLGEYRDNPWFTDSFWPESEQRIRLALEDIQRHAPPPARVLDIGCFNGFFCELLAELGYRATGTDAWKSEERDRRFAARGIGFFSANLNDRVPFADVPDGSFDVVFMGEVIEHVLNHPLGVLQEARRLLVPGGLLLVTTPNPSTVMNAWRLLRDRHSLWGTEEFATLPKFQDGQAISEAHIHYREYSEHELRRLIQRAGFRVEHTRFMPFGVSRHQPFVKRALKRLPISRWLFETRPFGSTQYVVARRD
jgi:SAM-dependent methyltransferase